MRRVRDARIDYQALRVRLPPLAGPAEPTAPVRRPVVVVGAGPSGLDAGDRPRAARHAGAAARRRRHGSRPARARSASPSARSRSSTGSAAATAWSTRACRGASARSSSATSRLPLRPAARARPRAPGVRQPAAVLRRGLSARARPPSCRLEIALGTRSSASTRRDDGVASTVETPDGRYRARGRLAGRLRRLALAVRALLGLRTKGEVFHDRFLIADVRIDADLPKERRFWFDPPFHPTRARCCTGSPTTSGASTSSSAGTPTRTRRRGPRTSTAALRAMLASPRGRDFELEWASVYTFACCGWSASARPRDLRRRCRARRLAVRRARRQRGRAGRRQPGLEARARARAASAPETLLDSYASEREHAADENIRALDAQHRLHHAEERGQPPVPRCRARRSRATFPFARALVNSGRLSVPTTHAGRRSTRRTPTTTGRAGRRPAGRCSMRRSARAGWSSGLGPDFTLLSFGRRRSRRRTT